MQHDKSAIIESNCSIILIDVGPFKVIIGTNRKSTIKINCEGIGKHGEKLHEWGQVLDSFYNLGKSSWNNTINVICNWKISIKNCVTNKITKINNSREKR